MKKALILFLLLALCVSVVACGNTTEETPADSQSSTVTEETPDVETSGDDNGEEENDESSSEGGSWEDMKDPDSDYANDNNWSGYVDVPQN